MNSDKIIVTSCVALGAGSFSAVIYDLYNGIDDKTNADSNMASCKCPFANRNGVGLVTGLFAGALTWLTYK